MTHQEKLVADILASFVNGWLGHSATRRALQYTAGLSADVADERMRDARLDQRVADIKSGKVTEGPALLAQLLPRVG